MSKLMDDLEESFMVKIPGVTRSKKFYRTPRKLEPTTKEEYKKLEYGKSYITKKGKIAWKQKPKEKIIDFLLEVMVWVVKPFWWLISTIWKPIHWFLWPKTNFHHNGIFGPGGRTSYDQDFSFGRLAFVLVVGFIIVYFIFLR
jgi:hypothetical protein